MKTGFREFIVDQEFARRSAKYLAEQGYQTGQIKAALVEELDLTHARADDIIATLVAA